MRRPAARVYSRATIRTKGSFHPNRRAAGTSKGSIVAKIFINYRASDEMIAAAFLEETLAAQFGSDEVFRDSNAIRPGTGDFRKVLWPTLARVSVMIAVIGPRWLGAGESGRRRIDEPEDYVREEISLALKIGIPVVPVLVGSVDMPTASTLPEPIRDLAFCQYLRFDGRTTRDDAARVVDAVVRLIEPAAASGGTDESAPVPPSTPGGRPQPVVTICAQAQIDARAETNRIGRQSAIGRLVSGALLDVNVASAAIAIGSRAGSSVLRLAPSDAAAVAAGLVGALSKRLDDCDRRHSAKRLWSDRPTGRAPGWAGENAQANAASPHLRLRLAIHLGDEGGAAILACRLAAAPPLCHTLDAATDARLALVVSDAFFASAVRGNPAVDASAYVAADLGEGLTGWVHVPGYPAPPNLAARQPRRDRAGSVPSPTTRQHVANFGPMYGDINVTKSGGSNTYNFGDGMSR